MLQTNPPQDTKVKEIDIIAGIKLVETEYQVRVPVFVDTPVDKPVFKDKEIEIPVGWDKVIDKVAERIVSGIMDNITLVIGARLDAAIDSRIKEIKYPKLIEANFSSLCQLNEKQKDMYLREYFLKNP